MSNTTILRALCGQTEVRGLRAMLAVAHPDDETVGAGILLGRLSDPIVVTLTDGAPRSNRDGAQAGFPDATTYAAARRDEESAALRIAKVSQCVDLGVPDQLLVHNLRQVIHSLVDLICANLPDVLITHPYEGGHPDHDAAACAVQRACELLRVPPIRIEMTSYFRLSGRFVTGLFLPSTRRVGLKITPTDAERQRKREMLACYRTQQSTLSLFKIANERFRMAPSYDFSRPPHRGPLHYETVRNTPLTGATWRALVADAFTTRAC